MDLKPIITTTTTTKALLPLHFEMTVSPSEEKMQDQDVSGASVVTDKGITSPQYSSQLAFLSFLQAPQPKESSLCLVARWDCENCSTLEVGSSYGYPSCKMDMDIEKETSGTPAETDGRTIGSSKSEGTLTRALHWKINLQIGSKIMQLLMNHSIMLLKFSSNDKSATERTPDTPINRWGRYKRAASFDSRKVAFILSLLSSVGTIVLIYLTLRVKRINDALGQA